MFCRKCGEQIPDKSRTCPTCGEEQYITMEEETEKNEGTDKMPVKILKGSGKVITKVAGTIIVFAGSAVADEFSKGVQKKTKKAVSKGMKAIGLKRKTPLDIAGGAVKAWQKKGRK